MRAHAAWRQSALTVARHTAAAAGLGVAWLLLSGGAASAATPSSGDPLSVVSPSPAAPAPSTPASRLVNGAVGTTAALTADPGGTLAGPTRTTTSTVISVGAGVPAVVAPLTDQPFSPLSPVLTPVVEATTSVAAGAVDTLGAVAGGATQGSGAVVAPVTQPLSQVLETISGYAVPGQPASGLGAASGTVADNAASGAPSSSDPVEGPSSSDLAAGVPAGDQVRRAAVGAGPAKAAVRIFAGPTLAAAVDTAAAIAPRTDAGRPGSPQNPSLPALAPGTAGGSQAGAGGGSGGPVALAVGAFSLALLWRAGSRLHPVAAQPAASPSFDPGSTPD